ncbi:MAG: dynamin family protein [Acidobacteriaceae bacterium]
MQKYSYIAVGGPLGSIADQSAERRSMEAALRTLLAVENAGANNRSLREKLLSLEKKLASNQLQLAVLGQMKRGKSSFVNALLGAEILPTGVLPVTAIVTEIGYGPIPNATIVYSTGGLRERVDLNTLADYITEAGNPGNKKQVASVEIEYPSPFLESGIVLIDTPGIGSTHVHNTRTTESYLQHVDAGIIVLSVDPPITEVESQFLRNLKEEIPKLFFILNKTDMASPDEIAAIGHFLENELDRLQISSPEIFPLSARRALREKCESYRPADRSGLEVFEQRLRSFLSEEKGQVLVRSVALDALHIAGTLKFAAAIGVRAQAMGPEELHRKQRTLDRLLEQTEFQVRELQMLLRQYSGDVLARVERDLAAQVEASTPVVRQHLKLFQVQHPKETGRLFATLLESFLMGEVESIFRSWKVREDEEVQTQLNLLSSRFVAQANGALEQLQQAAGSLFEVPVEHVSVACPLRVESHLYYKVEPVFYSLDSFLLVLPRFLLRPTVLRKMNDRIWQLLDMNAGRIRYDYLERLQSSIGQFEKGLSDAIMMVAESLRSALHKSNNRTQQEAAVLDVLDSVVKDCSQLLHCDASRDKAAAE